MNPHEKEKRFRRIGVILMVAAILAAVVDIVADFLNASLVQRISSAVAFSAFVFSLLFLLGRVRSSGAPPIDPGIAAGADSPELCDGDVPQAPDFQTPFDTGPIDVDFGGGN